MWTSLFVCAAFFVSFQLHSIAAFPGETSRVVVNEVYYDHPGRDEGWEYVELYNAGVDTVDLAGWRIESIDGGSGETARLWTGAPGAKILPGEAFCVAGSAREPLPGRVLVGALENGPDAVRLVAATGGIDVLGYGPLLLDGLFEGSPAPEAPAGMSLARRPDGADNDRNASDFVTAAPSRGRRNFFHCDIAMSKVWRSGKEQSRMQHSSQQIPVTLQRTLPEEITQRPEEVRTVHGRKREKNPISDTNSKPKRIVTSV